MSFFKHLLPIFICVFFCKKRIKTTHNEIINLNNHLNYLTKKQTEIYFIIFEYYQLAVIFKIYFCPLSVLISAKENVSGGNTICVCNVTLDMYVNWERIWQCISNVVFITAACASHSRQKILKQNVFAITENVHNHHNNLFM